MMDNLRLTKQNDDILEDKNYCNLKENNEELKKYSKDVCDENNERSEILKETSESENVPFNSKDSSHSENISIEPFSNVSRLENSQKDKSENHIDKSRMQNCSSELRCSKNQIFEDKSQLADTKQLPGRSTLCEESSINEKSNVANRSNVNNFDSDKENFSNDLELLAHSALLLDTTFDSNEYLEHFENPGQFDLNVDSLYSESEFFPNSEDPKPLSFTNSDECHEPFLSELPNIFEEVTGNTANEISDSNVGSDKNFQENQSENVSLNDNMNLKSSPLLDYDTDSTLVYPLNVSDYNKTTDSSVVEISTDDLESKLLESRSFSPLPSTSRDNVIIDINDTRFNEANGFFKGQSKSSRKSNGSSRSLDVIECSSDSDNVDDDVIVTTKANDVIDLVLEDDKTDSDCEIIDVDSVLAENNAILKKMYSPDIIEVKEISGSANDCQILSVEEKIDDENVIPVEDNSSPLSNLNPFSTLDKMACIVRDFFTKKINFIPEPEGTRQPTQPNMAETLKFVGEMMNLEKRVKHTRKKSDKHSNSKKIKINSGAGLQSSSSKSRIEILTIDLANNSVPSSSRILNHSGNVKSEETPFDLPSNVDNKSSNQSIECPVCLESIEKSQAISTFCGHIFCLDCITKSRRINKRCPSCRKTLKGKGYHPIFF